jgi:hypothetical protein
MLSLFVFVVAVVAVEVRFNATHNATFTTMADTASLALNVTIDQLYLNVNSDSGCIIFCDDAEEILIELKDVRLFLPLRAQGALAPNATLPLSGASICSATIWDPVEPDKPAVATLRTPLRLVPNRVVDITLTASWVDRIAFSNFEAPMIGFSALGFESDSGTTFCSNTASSAELHSGTFSNLRLCSQENLNCSALIGSANDGYVYWGPKPQYGARVVPSWSWSGTRRLARPAPSQVVDVAAVRSTSDIAASAVVSASSCPEFEMSAVELRNGSGLLFHVNKDGHLRRSLLTERVTVAAGAVFVLQFDEALKAVNDSTTDVQLQFPTLLRTVGQFGIEANSTPQLAVANAPLGWEVLASQFRFSSTGDHVALNVTVGDPKRAMIMTSLSSETLPPAPSFRCERNCAGHGICVGEQMCHCTNSWVNDPNRGCADPIEFVTQPPQTNTVAVISNVVDVENSTESFNSTATTTVGGVASSANSLTSPAIDQTTLIAAGAGGGAALGCVIACIVAACLIRKRRRSRANTRTAELYNNDVSLKAKSSNYTSSSILPTVDNYRGASSGTAGTEYDVATLVPKETGSVEYAVPSMGDTDDNSAGIYAVPQRAEVEYTELPPNKKKGKKGGFKPEGVAVAYEEFDADSLRFQKYKD